ncbi:MAG UNVERIFIED_CONTAM: hypothetical protein LVR18_40990 [Planctomycetaceae bacterium]
MFRLNHYLNADDIERALLSTGLDLAALDLDVSLEKLCQSLREGRRLPADHRFFATARMDGAVLLAPEGNGYLAASIVDFLREELLAAGPHSRSRRSCRIAARLNSLEEPALRDTRPISILSAQIQRN